MTLEDFINGVRYEIQGNVFIQAEKDGELDPIYESDHGIYESEVESYLNRIVEYVYADVINGKVFLVIELSDRDADLY